MPTRATHLRSLAVLAVLARRPARAGVRRERRAAAERRAQRAGRGRRAPRHASAARRSSRRSTPTSRRPRCGPVEPEGLGLVRALRRRRARSARGARRGRRHGRDRRGVLRAQRSQVTSVGCQTTNRRGEATVDFTGVADASYLIRVAPLPNSVQAGFRLRVVAPEPPATPPGPLLPAGGGSGQVDRFGNPDDAWSIQVQKGRAYRINLVTPGKGCARGALFAPGSGFGDQVKPLRCDAQTLFTPVVSGRYSIRVQAPRASRARAPLPAPRRPREARRHRARHRAGQRRPRRREAARLRPRRARPLPLLGHAPQRPAGPAAHDARLRRLAAHRRREPARPRRPAASRSGSAPGATSSPSARATATAAATRSRASRARSRARACWSTAPAHGALPAGGSVALQLRVSQQVDGPATFTVERFDPLAGWLFDPRFDAARARRARRGAVPAADRRALARDRVVRRDADRERQRGRHRALPGDGAADATASSGRACRPAGGTGRAASGCRACGP